jgi:tRNA(adenine34) deaminase
MEKPNDEFFMKKALDMAQEAYDRGEVPVGALVVCEGRIIAKAQNQTEMLHDATAHAEMLALTAACAHFQSKYLKECTLYVSLEPCPMCAAALYWTQVPRVVYGAKDEKRGYSLFQPNLLHPTTQVESGLLAEESANLLRRFFKERRGN